MVSVKVKLRRSSVAGKAGVVYFQIIHRRETRRVSTDIRLLPSQWDAVRQRVVAGRGVDACRLQRSIDGEKDLLRRVVAELESAGGVFVADDVVERFRDPEQRISFLQFMRGRIAQLTSTGNLGTARNYRYASESFASYLDGVDLPLRAFTDEIVEGYNLYLLRRGVVRNTVSFYMRILRAVYNMAVRRRLVEQTFPFRNVYTGVDRTRKRAVDESVISRLMRLDTGRSKSLEIARDLFMFSFYARGMAFVDMAYLRKSDIRVGIISYERRKTGQRLSVRLEPCMKSVVDRYADRARDTPYVFPILRSAVPEAAYRQYSVALNYYNRRLKVLSDMLGLEAGLSSYTSRHSWASVARNHHVPVSIISAGMGHASEQTTLIYLASLENSVIDDANRRVIALLSGAPSRSRCAVPSGL